MTAAHGTLHVLDQPEATAGEPRPGVSRRRGTAERAAGLIACASMVFQPILQPTGPANSSPVDLLTLGTVLMGLLWVATSGRRLGAPYAIGMGVLVVTGAVAGLAGPLPGTSLLTLSKDILLIIWCFVLYNIARRPRMLRLLTASFAYSAVVWATVLAFGVAAHIRAIEGNSAQWDNRVVFTLGNPNYAAAYWVTALFMVFATKCPRSPWARWYAYAVLLWALMLSWSNGGLLQLLVGLAFIALVTVYRKYGVAASLALLLTIAVTVCGALQVVSVGKAQEWARQSEQSFVANTLGRSEKGATQRQTLVDESLRLYSDHGVLGSGPGTTRGVLQEEQAAYANEAHNDYLAALVERSPMGVVGIVILLLSAGWRASVVLRAPPGEGFAAQVPRPLGVVAALLAMGLAGTYREVLHYRFAWILLALVAVLASMPDPDHPDAVRTAAKAHRGRSGGRP
ncbi:O-antigen ligase family protein [Streptomyces shaanxiensis]|uniref:O-antigen ligase-related domain-containing protein n=1 Tax=Streptomyces shaanxiensis TaxID=653357 RepID=A0ABP7V428_9ACTN